MKRTLITQNEDVVVSLVGYESSSETTINGETKIDYYFKHENGKVFTCVADTLEECRERCNKFLALKGIEPFDKTNEHKRQDVEEWFSKNSETIFAKFEEESFGKQESFFYMARAFDIIREEMTK